MKLRTLVLAAGLMAGSVVQADSIALSDGSTIQGKVISMSNGTYQIQTNSFGMISLPQSKVRSISSGAGNPMQSSSPVQQKMDQASGAAIQSLQSSMVNNPGIMSSIMSLQNDPDMQAVLRDPEVMRAVQSFDLQALQNHPKIKKLMQNQQIRQIRNKVN